LKDFFGKTGDDAKKHHNSLIIWQLWHIRAQSAAFIFSFEGGMAV